MVQKQSILWVDDEIELLEPHIIFLEDKGYDVTRVTNGQDAVDRVREERFDLVFLDEQMPGMNGLETLEQIKGFVPGLEVVMVTKSEEERIMDDAIGLQISDYLIKPVNPKQVLLTCKRLLDRKRISYEHASQRYLRSFGKISMDLSDASTPADWVEIYLSLVAADLKLEGDEGVRQVLEDQMREANREFGRYVESAYQGWIVQRLDEASDNRPVLSHEVIPQWVLPVLKKQKPVYLFVIDCMRQDQWLEFERLLYPFYDMEKDYHFSILPTATPYSRNAIFSGLLPVDVARQFPQVWREAEEDEHSRNRHEEELLAALLRRKRFEGKTHYAKVVRANEGRDLANSIPQLSSNRLNAIVVNFVDNLAHSRSDSAVLKEIAPDERAYRALTRTWFEHSWLFDMLKGLAETDCHIVVTTDHGVLRTLHPAKVVGDRETSTSLRYKFGRNLRCEPRHAVFVKHPGDYGLPSASMNTNYIIAKEDYYFVYPTNYNYYVNYYKDTMQHGGISLEEMILPVITMTPKK